ncbi:MAG TPA: ATP-binding protein [Thermosynechococcaceae cyanobacterium]
MSVLADIYNVFDPSPLPANSPLYVECKEVRGDSDVLVELGRKIERSNVPTCQLYSGHRGCGKSTELLRLADDLDRKGCKVVYFAVDAKDQGDVNPEDVEYTDILLACTRHLLKDLEAADPQPIASWLKERWAELNDVLKTKVSVAELKAEVLVQQMAKITATIRAQPNQRHEIRKLLNPHTESLVVALNEFIKDAKGKLPPGKSKLVVIADGLDKITLVTREGGRTNHDEVFIDRSTQLQALDCYVIYTVPISLVLSKRASDLAEIYSCAPHVLPSIMVQTQDNQPHEPGIEKLKDIVASRVYSVEGTQGLNLETQVFDSPETLRQLCRITGGHVRNLILLMQLAIDYTDDQLPITAMALKQAIRKLRTAYRETVDANQWALLAQVFRSKQIEHDEPHRSLLFSRCLLEYFEEDKWHDVHPILRDVPEFKQALDRLPSL